MSRADRVVQVVATGSDGRRRAVASGLLLVGDLAITASHAVRDPAARYEVRTARSAGRTAVRRVVAHAGRDIALLALDADRASLPPIGFADLPHDLGRIDVHAVGFPWFTLEGGRPRGHQMDGTIQLGSDRTDHQLQVSVATSDPPPRGPQQSPWAGYSGAGILTVHEGLLAGVVTSHRPTGDRRNLTGTDLCDLRDPDFVALLSEHGLEPTPLPVRQATAGTPAMTEPAHWIPPAVRRVLRRQLNAADELPYRFRQDRRPRRLTDVHVRQVLDSPAEPPQEGAEPSRNGGAGTVPGGHTPRAGRSRRLEDVLDEALAPDDGGHLVVVAGPGEGKSTLLHRCCLDLGRAALAAPAAAGGLVPLLVTAPALAEFEDLLDNAVATATGLGTQDGTLPRLPPGATWLVLIDALDEVPLDRRNRLIHRLTDHAREGAASASTPLRILLTTRRDPEAVKAFEESGFHQYLLAPFTRQRLQQFAHAWFKDAGCKDAGCNDSGCQDSGRPEGAARFLAQVDAAGLGDLLRNPLLATVTALVFESAPASPLPDNRWALYEQCRVQLLAAKRDQTDDRWRRLTLSAEGIHRGPAAVAHLRAHLEELVRHLAHAQVATGAQDLLREALRWWEETATDDTGRRFGAVPPLDGWRNVVLDALLATGLLVREGDGVREGGGVAFLHTTFAEHLAAEKLVAGLPQDFDLGREEWRAALLAASGLTEHPLRDLYVAALVHYCHRYRAGGRELLDRLLEEGHGNQMLAGELLAEGCPAEDGHYRRFLGTSEVRRPRAFAPTWQLLARIRHPEVTEYLAETAQRSGDWRRVAAGRALIGHDPASAARILAAASLDRQMDSELVKAARVLADSHPEHETEAAALLLRAVCDRRSADYVRREAAEALLGLGEEHAHEAAIRLGRIAADPLKDGHERLSAVGALAELGEPYRPMAASALRDLVAVPLTAAYLRRNAAWLMASLGRAYVGEAADVLKAMAADSTADLYRDRIRAAMELTHLGSEAADTAAAASRAIMDDATLDSGNRAYAGQYLARLGGAYAQEARRRAQDILEARDSSRDARRNAKAILDWAPRETPAEEVEAWREVLRTGGAFPAVRLRAGIRMAAYGGSAADEAVDALCGVLTDPRSHAYERARAAAELRALGAPHLERAAAVLRSTLRGAKGGAKGGRNLSVAAARALVVLSEPVPLDATLLRALILDAEAEPQGSGPVIEALRGTRGGARETVLAWMCRSLMDPAVGAKGRRAVAATLHALGEAWVDQVAAALRADTGPRADSGRPGWSTARGLLALGGGHVPTEPEILCRLARDPAADGRERLLAARALLCVGTEHVNEATRALRAVATARRTDARDRHTAAQSLHELGAEHWSTAAKAVLRSIPPREAAQLSTWAAAVYTCSESAAGLRDAFGGLFLSSQDRIRLAVHTARMGESHKPAAARMLRRVIGRGGTSAIVRREAADVLAGFGDSYAHQAVAAFRAACSGPTTDPAAHLELALFLTGFADLYRPLAVEHLVTVVANRWSADADRGRATSALIGLGEEFRQTAVDALRTVVDGDDFSTAAKQSAERLLAFIWPV
ncbi:MULTISPECIES: trypsin-like peptidase domain-containing protein [Streptomyces]|uniref:Trypsin-like peptidase domain-containing protein n=1 Tax=Streptomyces sp. 900129855 TaxID=3155129 RepID=A0ABV2ZFK3_9ACTN